MCGICGVVGPGAQKMTDAIKGMLALLRHRGPDASGEFYSDDCALGHARLSIIDLDSGAQPMHYNAHGAKLHIVYNGEIYNYKDLRSSLPGPFATSSDTEAILGLYAAEKDPANLCRKLKGMFAFGLWDEKEKRLVCARDRFGEKPFYYTVTPDGQFVFASELQALARSGLCKTSISKKALAEYLKFRYVPENSCIYEHISVLQPGCYLVWENGRLSTGRYWDLPDPSEDLPELGEAVEKFSALARQAVARCLVADVDVGLLLSGGLDSTTVALLASEHKQLESFSFGFRGWRDERAFARAAASQYGLNHHELTDEGIDLPFLLKKVTQVYGEPFADSSSVSTWLLCGQVRKHVKVALGGDGADELLGGYDFFYKNLLKYQTPARPIGGKSRSLLNQWRNMTVFMDSELELLGLDPVPLAVPSKQYNTIDDAFHFDIRYFLASDILRKTDRAAMSHGLELRSPFLDVDLAEFLIALPSQYKISSSTSKILLREAFAAKWPEAIRTRGKQGFDYDVNVWQSMPEVAMLRRHYLGDPRRKIYSLFPPEVLAICANDLGTRGWSMFMLSLWLEDAPCEV